MTAGAYDLHMDTWIAATAVTHGLPVYTQDEDFFTIPHVHAVRD